ncbi:hypothetical protein C8F01DRAFT_724051 [Mycena amicta]|nr:hypothetical protein C8F01DRAFT_724051 [Mycena amicta]
MVFFSSIPAKHPVRRPRSPPPPLMVPLRLTPIVYERFPAPLYSLSFSLAPRKALAAASRAGLSAAATSSPRALRQVLFTPPSSARRDFLAPPSTQRQSSPLTSLASDDEDDDVSVTTVNVRVLIPEPKRSTAIKAVKDLLLSNGVEEDLYEAMRKELTELAKNLDMSKYLPEQDPDALEQLHRQMCSKFGFLKDYTDAWPVDFFLRSYLHNSVKRSKEPTTKASGGGAQSTTKAKASSVQSTKTNAGSGKAGSGSARVKARAQLTG